MRQILNKTDGGKVAVGILFLVWATVVLSAILVFQKPVALQVLSGLGFLAWTLGVWGVIVAVAAGVGYLLLTASAFEPIEKLLLGTGIGLGFFGLAGFILAAFNLANPYLLLCVLLLLLAWQAFSGTLRMALESFRILFGSITKFAGQAAWMHFAVGVALTLVLTQSLAPPADGFDSLFYHLPVPAMWLRDGGLRLVDMPHYWFPGLVEGMFVWPMALGSDIVTQLLHMTFAVLIALLLWFWVFSISDGATAWWAMVLLLTIPAFLWLATWAYTDLALSFFILGALYSLWRWRDTGNSHWLNVTALMAGFAMGIKYTSFVLPVFVVIFIFARWFTRKAAISDILRNIVQFSVLALLVASPWYLRNWIWMQNPFYPFVFGGMFWDSFRAAWYSGAGTGIGWNLPELLLLPLNITLGHRETFNLWDGRIGPFFLILIPVTVWTTRKTSKAADSRIRSAFELSVLFFCMSALFWTLGVVNTASLWQTRLLFPGLLPLIVPMAFGIRELRLLDTGMIRISVVFSYLVILFISLTLLDFGLLVLKRHPLAVMVGIETRQDYLRRIQPGYSEALRLVNGLPEEANVLFLFEQRSYGMTNKVFIDAIYDNLAHALYRWEHTERLLAAWKQSGYTHVLLSRYGLEMTRASNPLFDLAKWAELSRLEGLLNEVDRSSDGNYVLYSIP